jgi:PAS domain S-box-containing protein
MTDQDPRTPLAADLRQRAEGLARDGAAPSPEDLEAWSPEHLRQALHELRVQRIELETQNEELRRTQAELEAARARYFDLYDLAPVGYCTLSETGLILEANLTAARLLGVPRNALVNHALSHFILKEDQDLYHRDRQRFFETASPQAYELRLVKEDDGKVFWAQVGTSASQDAAGAPIHRITLTDISERKQVEAALRESEAAKREQEALARYARQLIETSLDPAVTISAEGIVTDVNAATETITGLSRQRLIGSHFADYFTEPERAQAGYRAVLAQGRVTDYPLTFRHRAGALTEVLYNASVYRNEAGDVGGVFAVARDITERKRAETEARQQAVLIKCLLDSIPDIIFFKDVNGVYLGCNPPFAEFVGRGQEGIVGKTDYDLFDREIADFFKENDRRMLELRESRHNEEWITYPDGRKILIDTLKTPYWGADGRLLGILGISRDITVRQQAEEALRQATERLALAVRAGGVGIWDYDVANNRLAWDEQMFRLYGITSEQFGGAYAAWQAGVHPEDRARGDAEIQAALRGDQEFDTEFRVLWPDGTTRNIRALAFVQRDAEGRPLHMVGTNWDITVQKQTEKALRESEANFRTFFESMTDMIMVGTPEGRILYVNAAVERTLGYSADDLAVMPLLHLHPADKRQEAEAIFGAMFRGERESCPLPLARRDGLLVPVETRVWFGKWNGADCLFGISKNLSAEQEAQQRFERLFRNNPSLMALSPLPDRRFSDVNDAFLATLDYSRGEVIGKTAAELGLFPHPAQHSAMADKLRAEGRVANIEMLVRRKDGALLDGLFSGEVISSQGREYLLTVMVDISERKRVERELARLSVMQRELMRLATTFVNVPLERQDVAVDQSLAIMGQLIQADRAYLFSYDFGGGMMSNTHEWCASGITPEIGNLQGVPNAMVPDWVAAHRRGESVHVPRVAALAADGYLRQLLEPQGIRSLITLPLMQGTVCLGFVGFDAVREERVWQADEVALLRVLAELYAHFQARRAAERETMDLQKRLVEARDAAQAAALAKSLFLANMSHEIRTPLNAILGYAQIMERECHPCPVKPRLKAISRSGEHLLELITDLLELVRSDGSSITLMPSAFDFAQVIEDIRLMFVHRLETQGVTLGVSIDPGVPRFIYADQGKIRQVLVNLVGNAAKFTASGSVRLNVALDPADLPDGITLTVDVADTGCGIRDDEQVRIFDLFYMGESNASTGKGTGLGLPLSRRYARALGGDVTVTSHLEAGSCFRFAFKARVATDAGAAQPTRRGNVRGLAPDQVAFRVLVVDDDQPSRDMLAAMLMGVGFTVETVAGAAPALDRLSQGEPVGLVLMDKSMPGMDGYEALARMRDLPGGRELSVLIVTASGFADEREHALAVGANGYVSKPVRHEQLLAEIGRVTGVRYDYEPAPSASRAAPASAILDSGALACLSTECRRLLDQALRRGDIRQLRGLIEEISRDHAALATSISALLDAYDYDRLRRLLDAAKGTTA